MPRKTTKDHYLEEKRYTTAEGTQRVRYYVRFRDWKAVRRRVAAGE